MASYADRTYADTFVATYVLDTTAWDDATDAEKDKALALMTDIIDRLNFVGSKYDSDQENEFPRDDDTEVPEDIKKACVWGALALLDGINLDLEFDNLFMTSQRFGTVQSRYDRSSVPGHKLTGVPTIMAWRLLLPYLRDPLTVHLRKV